MKKSIFFGFLFLNLGLTSMGMAYSYCEGECKAYWETVSTLYKSSTSNTANEIQKECQQSMSGTGIIRYNPDCISHGAYTNCTLKCSYPVHGSTSTSSYGDTMSEVQYKIRNYCTSYFSSYANYQNFSMSFDTGACR